MIKNDGGLIAGVPFKTYDITVKRTLTTEEQQKIVNAFNQLKSENTSLKDIALLNEIYRKALGIENVFSDKSITTIMHNNTSSVFTDKTPEGDQLPVIGGYQSYTLNVGSYYNDYLAGNLFGGRRIVTGSKAPQTYNFRTRLARECNLVIGDILIGRTTSSTTIWIYTGENSFYKISGSIQLDSLTVTIWIL